MMNYIIDSQPICKSRLSEEVLEYRDIKKFPILIQEMYDKGNIREVYYLGNKLICEDIFNGIHII